jgi:hypothetical protein
MDFEKFIENINSDDVYAETVKAILSNNPCALHDAPDYLRDKEELVLFANRFDILVGEHMSSRLKKDKEFLLRFTRYNHTAPTFMDDSLRTNKEFLLSLIKKNHKTLIYLNLDYILGLKS